VCVDVIAEFLRYTFPFLSHGIMLVRATASMVCVARGVFLIRLVDDRPVRVCQGSLRVANKKIHAQRTPGHSNHLKRFDLISRFRFRMGLHLMIMGGTAICTNRQAVVFSSCAVAGARYDLLKILKLLENSDFSSVSIRSSCRFVRSSSIRLSVVIPLFAGSATVGKEPLPLGQRASTSFETNHLYNSLLFVLFACPTPSDKRLHLVQDVVQDAGVVALRVVNAPSCDRMVIIYCTKVTLLCSGYFTWIPVSYLSAVGVRDQSLEARGAASCWLVHAKLAT
jgi:hypothetical protein